MTGLLWRRAAALGKATTGGGGGSGPIMGVNVRADGGGGLRTSPSLRLTDFGRIPLARNPYYGLSAMPSTFPAGSMLSIAPEQRVQPSFQRLPSQILDGSYDSVITSYVSSVPAGWTVYLTYWHEPNDEIGTSGTFTGADFHDAWVRIGGLIHDAPKQAGATVIPAVNINGPNNGVPYNAAWFPAASEMPPEAICTIDKYVNPPPAINAAIVPGALYSGLYKDPALVYVDSMQAIADLGYQNRWGITEFNAPRRDNDPDESIRVQVLEDTVQYFLSRTSIGLPEFILLWEGAGTQFDQNFYTSLTRDWWRSYSMASP